MEIITITRMVDSTYMWMVCPAFFLCSHLTSVFDLILLLFTTVMNMVMVVKVSCKTEYFKGYQRRFFFWLFLFSLIMSEYYYEDGGDADYYYEDGGDADYYEDGGDADYYYEDGGDADYYYEDGGDADYYYEDGGDADYYYEDGGDADYYYEDGGDADYYSENGGEGTDYYEDGYN